MAPGRASALHRETLRCATRLTEKWESLAIMPQDEHLFLRHRLHRPRYAADAVTRLTPSRKRHPIGAKCGVIIDQHGRCIEPVRGPHGGTDVGRKHTGLEGER